MCYAFYYTLENEGHEIHRPWIAYDVGEETVPNMPI